MKIRILPRQSGRTTQLITDAAREAKIIVCANDRRRKMIESIAREKGLLIPKPVTMYEATHGGLTGYKSKVVIDDLEACVQSVIPNLIDYAICATDSCGWEDYGKESER